jgi:hypothetical protein
MDAIGPVITYDGNTLELELPVRPWDISADGIGGTATSAAGIVESYVVRNDTLVTVTFRALEAEIADLQAFAVWARSSGTTFTVRLIADDDDTEFTAHWHDPVWPDPVQFARSSEYRGMLETEVTFRVVGTVPSLGFWGTA